MNRNVWLASICGIATLLGSRPLFSREGHPHQAAASGHVGVGSHIHAAGNMGHGGAGHGNAGHSSPAAGQPAGGNPAGGAAANSGAGMSAGHHRVHSPIHHAPGFSQPDVGGQRQSAPTTTPTGSNPGLTINLLPGAAPSSGAGSVPTNNLGHIGTSHALHHRTHSGSAVHAGSTGPSASPGQTGAPTALVGAPAGNGSPTSVGPTAGFGTGYGQSASFHQSNLTIAGHQYRHNHQQHALSGGMNSGLTNPSQSAGIPLPAAGTLAGQGGGQVSQLNAGHQRFGVHSGTHAGGLFTNSGSQNAGATGQNAAFNSQGAPLMHSGNSAFGGHSIGQAIHRHHAGGGTHQQPLHQPPVHQQPQHPLPGHVHSPQHQNFQNQWVGNFGNNNLNPNAVSGNVAQNPGYGGGNFAGGNYSVTPIYLGLGGGGLGPLAYGSGYFGYTNPYFNTTNWVGNGFNYQQPFLVNQPVAVSYQPPVEPVSAAAIAPSTAPVPSGTLPLQTVLNVSVAAFKQNQFDRALEEVNRGIEQHPGEAVLHEFRALILFAKGDYQQAAATLHAVLAVGPGWDWNTLISVYSSASVYSTQFRALEGFVKQKPDDGAARFLLAYHYLTGGHRDAAARMLRRVVELVPNDRVAAELLKSLTSEKAELPQLAALPTPQPPPVEPTPAADAIDRSKVLGVWKASRSDGSTFTLKLAEDKSFQWSFTPHEQPTQSFEGSFTLAGNVVTLNRSGGGSLVAEIQIRDESHFRFKLVGAPADDSGLDFKR